MKLFEIAGNRYYHVTSLENLYDIIDDGFLEPHEPSYGTDQDEWPDGGDEERIYFMDNTTHLMSFAPSTPAVFLRYRGKLTKERGTGDFYTTERISVRELDYLSDTGWKPLVSFTDDAREMV